MITEFNVQDIIITAADTDQVAITTEITIEAIAAIANTQPRASQQHPNQPITKA